MKTSIKFLVFKKRIYLKLSKIFKSINSDDIVYDFIRKTFPHINEKYKNFPQSDTCFQLYNSKKQIFVFWWQGYENAPKLVKICIDSIKKNAGNHEVVLLTEKNWNKYANIPDYIITKLNEKKISLTHFSDVLRMELLSSKGGLWLDATIFVSKQIPDEYFEMPYFTIHYPFFLSQITKGKWCGFCQAGKPAQIIHLYCRDLFFEYWKNFDTLIDYFFIDYAMRFGYDNFPNFRTLVDSVPENNIYIKELDLQFNNEYQEENYKKILDSSVFFKLNWKRKYMERNEDGKLTN